MIKEVNESSIQLKTNAPLLEYLAAVQIYCSDHTY